MNQREITTDVMASFRWPFIVRTREIAKEACHRNADVCAVLRSMAGCWIASHGRTMGIIRTRRGYRRTFKFDVLAMESLDLSQEFSDVISEVEADSRFGLFLSVEERAG